MDEKIFSASDLVRIICKNIEDEKIQEGNKISSVWNKIVSSIKSNSINGGNIGKKMADHSRIYDLKNNVLIVEADHSGWIQMLGSYKKYILKGLEMNVPELKIQNIVFRLAETNSEVKKIKEEMAEKKSQENLKKQFDKNKEILEKRGFGIKRQNTDSKSTLPPELQKIFEDLKNSVDE